MTFRRRSQHRKPHRRLVRLHRRVQNRPSNTRRKQSRRRLHRRNRRTRAGLVQTNSQVRKGFSYFTPPNWLAVGHVAISANVFPHRRKTSFESASVPRCKEPSAKSKTNGVSEPAR